MLQGEIKEKLSPLDAEVLTDIGCYFEQGLGISVQSWGP